MKYETNFTGTMFLSFLNSASGQEIPLPESMPQAHPRVLTTPEGKQETWNLIKTEEWAKDVFDKLRERTEKYTDLTATGRIGCCRVWLCIGNPMLLRCI